MAQVSAPYNFVPLNENVFFPPWANLINHDVPFKDGLSGQIELEITTESPIFIRKPYEEGDDFYTNKNGEKISKEFCHLKVKNKEGKVIDKKYYIPGSSVKGEIASVLEIMSFSKLRFFNDEEPFSQRDWENSFIYKKGDFSSEKIKGGWLSQTKSGFQIEYNSDKEIGRISHIELNRQFKDFSKIYGENYNAKEEKYSLAKHKYISIGFLNDKTIAFEEFGFSFEKEKYQKKIYTFDKQGKHKGKIILTGQSSKNINKGKKYEFIFWEPNETITIDNDAEGKIPELISNFFLTYNNHKPKEQTDDWKMWKKQLDSKGKVPIFITLKNDRDNEKEIEHFGLSMLYKLLYKNSIKDLLNKHKNHFDLRPDFIEILFGNIESEKLKGRVHFSHAFSVNKPKEFNKPITTTLAPPKASFYPFYIKQNFRSEKNKLKDKFEIKGFKYLTFNDDGEIAGRKRYPAMERNSEFYDNDVFRLNKTKTTTTFYPLKDGAEFSCNILFHNLLPEELGGLLSALSFHNNTAYNHCIGMGKPLGLGSVKINVTEINIKNDKKNIGDYLDVFETAIEKQIPHWNKTEQLKELFALATPISENKNQLEYLKLIPEISINQFSELKKLREKNGIYTQIPKALPRYSIFMGLSNIDIESRIIKKDINYKDSNVELWEKASKINNINRKINSQIKSLKEDIVAVKEKIKKINKKLNHVKEQTTNLKNIIYEEIVLENNNVYEAIVYSFKPKKATIKCDSKNIEVQLIFPKGFDITKINVGDKINVNINQLSTKNKKISAVKIKEN